MGALAIIGGSGLSNTFSKIDAEKLNIQTPYGETSSNIYSINQNNIETYFLSRHGEGHLISPSNINYRANIYALKKLGVSKIISISAVGSLDEKLEPGTFVLCDQFVDYTKGRKNTFYDEDLVVHVSMGEPICQTLARSIEYISSRYIKTIYGGTYVVIEGPQFSTKAESIIYKNLGCSVIGMTNMPEAKLAREAGICYATLAMVTDFDSWHSEHAKVTVDVIVNTMRNNLSKVELNIKEIISNNEIMKFNKCSCCGKILESSLSDIRKIKKETINKNKILYE
jgi:5'-methylthioadenosine phosphorylase